MPAKIDLIKCSGCGIAQKHVLWNVSKSINAVDANECGYSTVYCRMPREPLS